MVSLMSLQNHAQSIYLLGGGTAIFICPDFDKLTCTPISMFAPVRKSWTGTVVSVPPNWRRSWQSSSFPVFLLRCLSWTLVLAWSGSLYTSWFQTIFSFSCVFKFAVCGPTRTRYSCTYRVALDKPKVFIWGVPWQMMMNRTVFYVFLFSVLEPKHALNVYMAECIISQMIRGVLWLLLCKLLFSLLLLAILFFFRRADFALLRPKGFIWNCPCTTLQCFPV